MPSHNQPYSQHGLEQLAIALGVDTAQIWHDPQYHRLEVKQLSQIAMPATVIEEFEDEEE